jgi:hypothetical protein
LKSKICAVFLLIVLPFSSALAQSDAADDASDVFESFLTSFTNGDFDGVVGLFSEDAMFWGTGSPTLVEVNSGIQQYFARLNTQGSDELIARAIDYSALVLSESSVLVSGMWEIIPTGETEGTPLRVSMALALRNGQWKIVQFHNSAVPG